MTMVDVDETAPPDAEHEDIVLGIEAVFDERPRDIYALRVALHVAQRARSGHRLGAALRRSKYFADLRTGNRYIPWLPNLCDVVSLADRSYIVEFLIDTTEDRFVFECSGAKAKKTVHDHRVRPRGLR